MTTRDEWNLRAGEFAKLYRSGQTLQEIGEKFGITREAVRRAISKRFGSLRGVGGIRVKFNKTAADRTASRDARYLLKHGCTFAQYAPLRGRVTAAFLRQRTNAARRGIEWGLTFWEWWSIWEDSGHWQDRGRLSHQYVMCRVGDRGGYEVGNVYIETVSHNCSGGKIKQPVVDCSKLNAAP